MHNIVINGFGRIGRMILRSLLEKKYNYNKIIINDPNPKDLLLHLFKYDSIHGIFTYNIDKKITFTHHKTPFYEEEIDIVLECSGHFTSFEKSSSHIRNGAKKVLISAPSKNPELTVIYGINHHEIKKHHKIISNGSCTTNCVTPLLHILNQEFGVTACHFTTIHAYTASQNLVDGKSNDLRHARASLLSMIPSTTGASDAVQQIFPHIKITGSSVRVPISNVSMVDIIFETIKPISKDHIHQVLSKASQTNLKSIIHYNTEEIVSIDCNHTPYSAIFDATQTQITHPHLAKISAFYDNEWGFTQRMYDVMDYWLKV